MRFLIRIKRENEATEEFTELAPGSVGAQLQSWFYSPSAATIEWIAIARSERERDSNVMAMDLGRESDRVEYLTDITEEVVKRIERESGDSVASALEDLTTATDNVADANRTIALEIGSSLTQAVESLASATAQIAEALKAQER